MCWLKVYNLRCALFCLTDALWFYPWSLFWLWKSYRAGICFCLSSNQSHIVSVVRITTSFQCLHLKIFNSLQPSHFLSINDSVMKRSRLFWFNNFGNVSGKICSYLSHMQCLQIPFPSQKAFFAFFSVWGV